MRNLTAALCLTLAVLLGTAGGSWSADPVNGLCRGVPNHSHHPIFDKCSSSYELGNYATALLEWNRFAKKENAGAQYNLGQLYRRGQGVAKNYKTAVKWYTLAAKQGNAGAQNNLGAMYQYGLGVPQDYKTAVKWYTLAVKQGHVSAQKRLSILQKKLKSNQKTAIKKQLKSKSYRPCEQHKMFKDPKVWAGMLIVAATISKNKNFRFSFPLSTTLHCNFKGKPGRQTLSFTPEPRHPKINRRYVDVSLGIGKSCAIFMAADTSIKNQAALNVIYNFKTKKYKNNPGYSGWNKFCN